ncbi:MAG: ornithine cyclodeaminase family protein [Bacteroidota bacterium]|nr:ornithine cyclodeaminase family protein [Bacteroidota bacterium]
MLPFIDGHTLQELLDPESLISALRLGFVGSASAPPRSHVSLPRDSGVPDTLLMMPAWNEDVLGIKLATIHPGNVDLGLPPVHASYVLKDRQTGQDLALMDGAVLTRLRTAAASALAADYAARSDASTLLMVGAGSLAIPLIEAHCAVRPIKRILLWNRSRDRAHAVVAASERTIELVDDLDAVVSHADIISCATLSTEPLVRGDRVAAGTHVDLVGAYRPDMRESDADLIARAAVFVDTYEGARQEAGDLLLAANETAWSLDRIQADLAVLCRGAHPGRSDPEEITVFKSVGASIEDLVAAALAWDRYQA